MTLAPVSCPAQARSGAPERSEDALRPSRTVTLEQLESLARAFAPDLEGALLDVSLARTEVTKSGLLPNPALDLSWGTIPVGETNPTDLEAPFANVPNYSAGVSYTAPLGKRKPLRARAQALRAAADQNLVADVRGRALGAAQILGALATTALRVEGLKRLVEAGQELVSVARARVEAKTFPGLDLDRLRLDVARLEQGVLAAESEEAALLSQCTAILGVRCDAFDGPEEARAFLEAWIARVPRADEFERRPDLEALKAEVSAADSEARWARALKIPDPTIRVGYVHDRFLVAGNQQNSLNLSVSLPLLFSDSGQAEREAARARGEHARAELEKRTSMTRARLPRLREALAREALRQEKLRSEVLPNASAVLRELSDAADKRLVSIGDVIIARRTLSETLLDEVSSLGAAFSTAVEIMAELNQQETQAPRR